MLQLIRELNGKSPSTILFEHRSPISYLSKRTVDSRRSGTPAPARHSTEATSTSPTAAKRRVCCSGSVRTRDLGRGRQPPQRVDGAELAEEELRAAWRSAGRQRGPWLGAARAGPGKEGRARQGESGDRREQAAPPDRLAGGPTAAERREGGSAPPSWRSAAGGARRWRLAGRGGGSAAAQSGGRRGGATGRRVSGAEVAERGPAERGGGGAEPAEEESRARARPVKEEARRSDGPAERERRRGVRGGEGVACVVGVTGKRRVGRTGRREGRRVLFSGERTHGGSDGYKSSSAFRSV